MSTDRSAGGSNASGSLSRNIVTTGAKSNSKSFHTDPTKCSMAAHLNFDQLEPIRVDLASHQIIPISRVPEVIGRTTRGKKVSMAAVYRWMSRASMPFLQMPGGRVTSVEALQLWAERRTQGASAAPTQTSLGRQRAIERAAKEAQSLLNPGKSGRATATTTPEFPDRPESKKN